MRRLSLIRTKIAQLHKVRIFLGSIRRNSISSEKAYLNGLVCFQGFLSQNENLKHYSIETILASLSKQEINLYELFDGFVSFLMSLNLSVSSIKLYVGALRSLFAYYDIDVVPSKFKRKVKMPRAYREDEEALDVQDIRNILLACNNRRLKAYILTLASGGFRAARPTGSPPRTSPSSSPTPPPARGSTPRTTPTPATPGRSPGGHRSTSDPSGWPADRSPPKPSPPT